MRLDKFLQVSRIIKRRPVANEVCNRGKVLVNRQPAKASKIISPGDVIAIDFGERENRGIVTYEVLKVPTGDMPKSKATTLYQVCE